MAALGAVLLRVNDAYGTPYSIPTFVAVALLVALAPNLPVWPGIVGRIVDYLGDLSYPIYLFHLPTFLLGFSILGVRSPAALLAAAAAVSAGMLFLRRWSSGSPFAARPAQWSRPDRPDPPADVSPRIEVRHRERRRVIGSGRL